MKKWMLFAAFAGASLMLSAAETLLEFSPKTSGQLETTGRTVFQLKNNRAEITIPANSGAADFRWPGINFNAPPGKYFDLSGHALVAMEITNLSPYPIELNSQIDNDGADGNTKCTKSGIALNTGETATFRIRVARNDIARDDVFFDGALDTFDGLRGPHNLDPAKIRRVKLFLREPAVETRFAVADLRLEEPRQALSPALKSPETFYPCIDIFGQYKHAEWPNKLKSEADFALNLQKENAQLAAMPKVSANRTPYGGWADGPSFKATGHFYPTKHNARWYLVDPTGKLFWSLGIDSIYYANRTGLDLRRHYFENLPSEKDPVFGRFFSRSRAVARYYRKQNIDPRTYDFYAANLYRKYGENYVEEFARRTGKRLASWGFNTIGNWSSREVIQAGNMPYVAQVNADGAPKLEGDNGFWYKFWEVYSPKFTEAIEAQLKKEFPYALNDPYCIGFFVDNEISWGGATGLSRSVLRSPAAQPSKLAFAEQLKKQYHTIDKLNAVWKTTYQDWPDFLKTTSLPDEKFAAPDMKAFNEALVDRYFRLCREAVKKAAPNKLYMGSRFAFGGHPVAVRHAAKYADVMSFNHYLYSVAHVGLPDGLDKPIIIGEFHFGTINSGPACPGLKSVPSQAERARAIERYVESALYNPLIVGVHYFKYSDQPTSGRSMDDENMQIGFVDIADTPYQEVIEATRKLNRKLYEYREAR